ncbi:MAG TPA: RDD family protein [Nocardioides sp.]|uniref:RDD family protein n=1 Tax=Nocardioides sp. TaxID=35761 RepID=UPI002E325670|nr:RDD family protein [Nocardioides sp.]HEX5086975.1 RDD family protein [Nocardioides sp.]
MADGTVRPPQKGLIGRVAGAVTDRALDVVDPDIVLDHVDVNSLLDKVDVQRLLERIDLDAVLQQVDMNALLSRVDMNTLLARVDMNSLLARVDVNQMLEDVDLEAVVRRSGIPEVVAESTSHLAGSTIDIARRQVAGLDFWVNRAVDTVLRREAGSFPVAPPTLAEAAASAEGGDRREVTGHYAGPVGRTLAFAVDAAIVTLVYTGASATLDWLTRILFDQTVVGRLPGWLSAVFLVVWLFVYFFGSLAVAGRTVGQGLVGLRVVARDGTTLRPWPALVRTVSMPVSFAFLGLGLVGVVVGREHRALHDVTGRAVVVVDFGDRPAELPGPLSRFLDRQGE